MKITSTIVALLTLGFCLLSSQVAMAQKAKDIPVTTSIEGTGAQGDPTVNNYRIQSDLLGPYRNRVDSVVSVMQGFGEWQFDALDSSRSVLFDFRDPVPNSNATSPFSVGRAPAKFVTKSYTLYGSATVSSMKGLNSVLISPLHVTFVQDGEKYIIWMSSVKHPETNFALVTCTGVVDPTKPDTSQCNQWRIEPAVTQPDGQRKNIAKLVRSYSSKGKILEEDHGNFYLSFSISLTSALEQSASKHAGPFRGGSPSTEGEGSGYDFWRSSRTPTPRPPSPSNSDGSVGFPGNQPKRIR
jgi:hypothetical protein